MANKTLFSSIKSKFTRTDTVNEAGGRAYQFTPTIGSDWLNTSWVDRSVRGD